MRLEYFQTLFHLIYQCQIEHWEFAVSEAGLHNDAVRFMRAGKSIVVISQGENNEWKSTQLLEDLIMFVNTTT